MPRELFDEEHELFRESFRAFVEKEISPFHETWEKEGKVDKSMFRAAGAAGFLGTAVPEEYGGGGNPDFRFNIIMNEELQRAGVTGSGLCLTLHNDIVQPYLLSANEEQKARWLPGFCSGEIMTAIGMTEPGTGSDLASIRTTAVRDGDHYVVNGAKTFITNGINSDLVVVAATHDPAKRHRGISLLVVEDGMEGFERGRMLDKVGLKSQDTAELFFNDVRVPVENRLGEEGTGFVQLMSKLPQERLSIAVGAVATSETAFEWTLGYCKEREAFGQPIGSFQHSRFVLAEMRTEIDIARVYVDRQIGLHLRGELTAEEAAKAKWWCTELQKKVVDQCVQLHGGYGYMVEYPIARAWRDARVQTIYGGTTEIMKEIIGRSLGV